MDPNIPLYDSLPEFTSMVTYNTPVKGIHTCTLQDGRLVYMKDSKEYWERNRKLTQNAIQRNIDARKRMYLNS